VFPLVSKSTFDDDRDTTRRYINVTMRYSLIFATAIAVVMAANPRPLLDIPYADDYAQLGAPALAVLALGNVAFSLFAIAGTILNGAGFTRDAIIGATVTLVVAAVGNVIAIPQCEPGGQVLVVAASVTAGSMVIGALVSGWFVHRRLGAFVPVLTLARVGVAVAAAIAVGQVVPFTNPLATLVEAAVVGVTFVVVLVVTRELGKADLRTIVAVRAKRGQGGDAA
jgi:O-antigen/teichoic acid export membrane protein